MGFRFIQIHVVPFVPTVQLHNQSIAANSVYGSTANHLDHADHPGIDVVILLENIYVRSGFDGAFPEARGDWACAQAP